MVKSPACSPGDPVLKQAVLLRFLPEHATLLSLGWGQEGHPRTGAFTLRAPSPESVPKSQLQLRPPEPSAGLQSFFPGLCVKSQDFQLQEAPWHAAWAGRGHPEARATTVGRYVVERGETEQWNMLCAL